MAAKPAAWWNERLTNALDRVTPHVEQYARELMAGAELGLNFGIGIKQPPITYEDLVQEPPEVALEAIGRMMQYPLTQRDGVAFFARLLAETDGLRTLGVQT